MRLSNILTLSSAVSAIDIAFHNDGGCDLSYAYHKCTNIEANTCCGVPAINFSYSVSFYNLAADAKFWGDHYNSGNCNRYIKTRMVDAAAGLGWCTYQQAGDLWADAQFSGAKWHPLDSKKRGAKTTATEDKDCQRPDTLVLEDGQQYDLTGLSDDDFSLLVGLAFNGTVTGGIPDVFQGLAIAS